MSPFPSSQHPRNTQILHLNISAKQLPRPVLAATKTVLHKLLGFRRFNAIYSGLPECAAADFSRTVLDAMHVRIEATGRPIDTIPQTGPLIVIANHPFGLSEAAALEIILLKRRPQIAVMTNKMLAQVPELHSRCIFVDPRNKRRNRRLNVQAWRRSFRWLAQGGALALFPAGRVARFQWSRMGVADVPWSSHIGALARRSNAPVLPLYFHGHNGSAFQLMSVLCPPLQDFLLLNEFNNKRDSTMRVSLGRIITSYEISCLADDTKVTELLRDETDKLAASR